MSLRIDALNPLQARRLEAPASEWALKSLEQADPAARRGAHRSTRPADTAKLGMGKGGKGSAGALPGPGP